MIAVTNSAVDSSCTARRAPIAGITVRCGSSENPRTVHAMTHATARAPSPGAPWNTAICSMMSVMPTMPPRAAPRTRM